MLNWRTFFSVYFLSYSFRSYSSLYPSVSSISFGPFKLFFSFFLFSYYLLFAFISFFMSLFIFLIKTSSASFAFRIFRSYLFDLIKFASLIRNAVYKASASYIPKLSQSYTFINFVTPSKSS